MVGDVAAAVGLEHAHAGRLEQLGRRDQVLVGAGAASHGHDRVVLDDQLSDTMKAEIEGYYPEYVAPPHLDDPRRNETSWIYYKKVVNGERTPPDRD